MKRYVLDRSAEVTELLKQLGIAEISKTISIQKALFLGMLPKVA